MFVSQTAHNPLHLSTAIICREMGMMDSRTRKESHLLLVEGRRSFLNVTNGHDPLHALNALANAVKIAVNCCFLYCRTRLEGGWQHDMNLV